MRDLFISEHRYISNILREFSDIQLQISGPIVREYYAPPRTKSRVRFNNDYFLEFVSEECLSEAATKAYGSVILPNTLGVQVFLVVDERTSKPLMTELLGGEAFSMKDFKEHIERVEDRLAHLSRPVNLCRASYVRIFVIDSDVCFLAFPNEAIPTAKGKHELLCIDEESSIACSTQGSDVVFVDGWIRTNVVDSERKLEAIAV